MGAGLKPVFRPVCPKCGIVLRYTCSDSRTHPDNWVLTAESRSHLGGAHNEINTEVREVRRSSVLHRLRKHYRFPARRRIDAVSGIGRN